MANYKKDILVPNFIYWNNRRIHPSRLTTQETRVCELLKENPSVTQVAKQMDVSITAIRRLRDSLQSKAERFGEMLCKS